MFECLLFFFFPIDQACFVFGCVSVMLGRSLRADAESDHNKLQRSYSHMYNELICTEIQADRQTDRQTDR